MMNLSHAASFFFAVLSLFITFFVNIGEAAAGCGAPQEITRFMVELPHTARAIQMQDPLAIVAIGSSSTEGVGASDRAHTYPAVLDTELQHRWPKAALRVINKGVGGEMAPQMIERFDRDVLAYSPQLVIWQTGSNQILRSEDIEHYAETLRDGISRLKSAGTDVILMDPQFAPSVLARRMHSRIVDSISSIADDTNVAVFQRFAVMRHWVLSGQFKIEDVITSDGLHMNDLGYTCVARLLADSIVAAANPKTKWVNIQGASMHARGTPTRLP